MGGAASCDGGDRWGEGLLMERQLCQVQGSQLCRARRSRLF